MQRKLFVFALVALITSTVCAKDYFLTIGGGYAPSGNQASLENNVLFSQRAIAPYLTENSNSVFFADGTDAGKDLEVMDREGIPKANRLMAEFFGSQTDLGLSYRNHRVPGVRGTSSPRNIRTWFSNTGAKIKSGDRLIVYVTAHGQGSRDRRNTHDTTIAMWNNTSLKMTEFVELLDSIDTGAEVICIMVQCHAGGYARIIFKNGDPNQGLARQRRIGFFATVHDRQAAGCTPEVDESTYAEYSTYFWAAVSGKDRLGNTIEKPDYDGDGFVSMEEAHAYTVITSDTIDLPIKSSGEFLTRHGRYGRQGSNLFQDDAPYDQVLAVASPSQKAVLNALSEQLNLTGNNRSVDADRQGRNVGSGRGRSRRRSSPAGRMRMRIADDLKRKWPGLANVMNPIAIELITTRKNEFIREVEQHPDYAEYRELAEAGPNDNQKKRVKYERFLRTVDNVIFSENIRRGDQEEVKRQLNAIIDAERKPLFSQ